MTKFLSGGLTVMFVVFSIFSFTSCEVIKPAPAAAPVASVVPGEGHFEQEEEVPLPPTKPQITLISKKHDSSFGETIISGAMGAAERYNVDLKLIEITEDSLTEVINSALDENISAICMSLDEGQPATAVFIERITGSGIPVIGFDTGISDAPPGLIMSTAQTDNYAAGAAAAEAVFASPITVEKIRNAKPVSPVTFTVLAEDAEDSFTSLRIRGFLDKMAEKASAVNSAGIQLIQNANGGASPDLGDSAVILTVVSSKDCQRAATATLEETEGLIGMFCAGEAEAEGLLAATSGGADLNRSGGKYKDLMVIGFEAGEKQKNAVKNQYFYCAVAEDPYQMGYRAIELAYDALQGDKVPETADTGYWVYTFENMGNRQIAPLLYD